MATTKFYKYTKQGTQLGVYTTVNMQAGGCEYLGDGMFLSARGRGLTLGQIDGTVIRGQQVVKTFPAGADALGVAVQGSSDAGAFGDLLEGEDDRDNDHIWVLGENLITSFFEIAVIDWDGDVVESQVIPCSQIYGGCWAGQDFYYSFDTSFGSTPTIRQGGVHEVGATPIINSKRQFNPGFITNDMAWDGEFFWVIQIGFIGQYDLDFGHVGEFWAAPTGARGVTTDGEFIWICAFN